MKKYWLVIFLFLTKTISAQLVEVYVGHQRTGVDILWYNFIKNEKQQNTKWLFFNRNRASVDYSNKTQWTSINAISYNFSSGIAVVATGNFGATGFVPNLGIQYVKKKKDFLFFGWLVSEIKKDPLVDLFGLLRYEPKLSEKTGLLFQLESNNLIPATIAGVYTFTQRVRVGIKKQEWQYGLMLDLTEIGINRLAVSTNAGIFLRHEF